MKKDGLNYIQYIKILVAMALPALLLLLLTITANGETSSLAQDLAAGPSPGGLQFHHVYTRSPGLVIPSDGCVTDVLTVTAPGTLRIADIDAGLNMDMYLLRGAFTATLQSPHGTRVRVLPRNMMGFHANYDVWLDDEASSPLEDGNDDDTGPPMYDRRVLPGERLAAFDGESAQGVWALQVCGNSGQTDGLLNHWTLDFALREPGPIYAVPHSHKRAPYKVEPGAGSAHVLVVTNTGELAGAATVIREHLPPQLTQSGPATYAPLGSGVVVSGFQATNPISWLGRIPAGAGVIITVPTTVTAPSGTSIVHTFTISDPRAPATAILGAPMAVYPRDSVYRYEDFNVDDGGFVANDDTWRRGIPASGPVTCHSHPGCWSIAGGMPKILTGTLDLPAIPPTQTLWLQWWEWLDVVEDLSVAAVYIVPESAPPVLIHGGGGMMGLTADQRAHERTWRELEYDVTPYADQTVTLYFYLTMFLQDPSQSWVIDDVAVHVREAVPSFTGSYKVPHTDKVAPGDTLTYTLLVTNSGHLTSTDGRMFDRLPPGLSLNAATLEGSGSLSSGSDWVAWTTAPGTPLPPGEGITLTLATTVDAGAACGQPLTNTATLTDAATGEEVTVAANPVRIYPDVYHTWDLELDAGGFISNTTGEWEWGAPDATAYPAGPPGAHSGQNVWGTRLDTYYDQEDSYLTRTVDLSGIAPATGLILQWWEWLRADDEWHQAYVQIASTAQPSPTVVYGREVDGLTQEQRGREGRWTPISVDLTPWAGELVTLTFAFENSFLTVPASPGWYLDDLSIHADCPHISVQPGRSGHACPGSTAVYSLTVRNATDDADVLDVLAGEDGWPARVQPATLSLGPGETGVVTASVDVPLLAWEGSTGVTEVAVTGQSSGLSGVGRIETTVGPHWSPVAPYPEAAMFHALIAYNGEAYLMGGVKNSSGDAITPSRKYSPTTDTWYDLAPGPEPAAGAIADACLGQNSSGDPVIVLFPSDFGGITSTYVYDIQSDAWYTRPYTSPLPAAGLTTPAIVSDREHNLCYLCGGQIDGTITHTLYAYDVAANTATRLPSMDTPRIFHAAWLYEGMVCVGGGSETLPTLTPLDSTQCYSITGGSWLPENGTLGSLPYPAWGVVDAERATAEGKQLWIMGGFKQLVFTALEADDRTAYWDPATEAWKTSTPLPQPVFLGAGAGMEDAVYVVGGSASSQDGFDPRAFNQRLVPCAACQHLYLPVVLRGF